MNFELKKELVAAIQKWTEEQCEEENWPGIVVGNDTVFHMASAAESVFDACLESQQYGIQNGNFEAMFNK